MHAVVEEGKIMNWENILAANLLSMIRRHKDTTKGCEPPFFMSVYLLDLICVAVPFPNLNLCWKFDSLLIHEVFQIMWVYRYQIPFYLICNEIMPRIYHVLNGSFLPQLSIEVRNTIRTFGHWYLTEFFTIIRIAGNEAVHYLSWFVPDHLTFREVAFQTVYCGLSTHLAKH